jgi:hypothetical protein
MYLIDANTLMEAHDTFYPIDRIPQFWDWLVQQGTLGMIKMPYEIHKEFDGKEGLHVEWINDPDVKAAILLEEDADPALIMRVINDGYQGRSPLFDDVQHTKYGKDPFLIAYALAAPDRVVVTREISRRTQRLGNTKLPDACDDCGIRWINDFELYRRLNFNLRKP